MATPGLPLRDSASIFNEGYDNPESRFGVANARVSRGKKQTLTSRPSEDGRRYRPVKRRYQGPNEVSNTTDSDENRQAQLVDSRYYNQAEPAEQIITSSKGMDKKMKVQTSAFAHARGISFGVTTISWLTPVYLFWQLPIAAVGATMLGLATQVESSYLLTAVDTTAQIFGSLFGYDYIDLTALGMLAVISAALFGVASASIAGFTAIMWRLHPLSGNRAGTKQATFLVGIVGACIPFANLFPWIIFWVLVMMRHPK